MSEYRRVSRHVDAAFDFEHYNDLSGCLVWRVIVVLLFILRFSLAGELACGVQEVRGYMAPRAVYGVRVAGDNRIDRIPESLHTLGLCEAMSGADRDLGGIGPDLLVVLFVIAFSLSIVKGEMNAGMLAGKIRDCRIGLAIIASLPRVVGQGSRTFTRSILPESGGQCLRSRIHWLPLEHHAERFHLRLVPPDSSTHLVTWPKAQEMRFISMRVSQTTTKIVDTWLNHPDNPRIRQDKQSIRELPLLTSRLAL